MAKISQPRNNNQWFIDKTRTLNPDQTEKRKKTKNITANLVQAISQVSSLAIFLFNLLIRSPHLLGNIFTIKL